MIRMVLALATKEDLFLEHWDIEIAFLHGDLDEEIYIKQPQGFEVWCKEKMVCKLQKSFMVSYMLPNNGIRSLIVL